MMIGMRWIMMRVVEVVVSDGMEWSGMEWNGVESGVESQSGMDGVMMMMDGVEWRWS